MEFIDKHDQERIDAFNALIEGFFAQGKIHYKDLNEGERQQVRSQLSTEQNGYCAFCMQKTSLKGTVEHVIPQGIPYNKFRQAYKRGPFYPAFIHQDTFDVNLKRNNYPHSFAYGNMVLLCPECNQTKWEEMITPSFFFNPTNVQYNPNGKVLFPPDALNLHIRTYLNESTFTNVRSLWRAIKQAGFSVADVAACANSFQRQELLNRVEQEMCIEIKKKYQQNHFSFIRPFFWNILLSFEWFWGYY